MPYYRVWEELFHRHGCRLPLDQWLLCVGRTDVVDFWDVLEGLCGRQLDRPAMKAALRQRFLEEIRRDQAAMPGVKALLRMLRERGIPAGLASTSDWEWVSSMLREAGLLDCFQAIVTRSDVPRGKPEPDVYLKCAERLGVRAERCLALEDSCYGLEAAKRAGMTCYVVPSELTRLQDLSKADGLLASLEELDLASIAGPARDA